MSVRNLKLVSLLSVAIVLSNCTKPGETTAVGAATGGALGAGLGAIVGSQSGSAGGGLVLGAVAGSMAGGAIGNAIEDEHKKLSQRDRQLEEHERIIAQQRQEIDSLTQGRQDVPAGSLRNPDNFGLQAGGARPAGYGDRARMRLPQGAVPVTKLRAPHSEAPVAAYVPPAPAPVAVERRAPVFENRGPTVVERDIVSRGGDIAERQLPTTVDSGTDKAVEARGGAVEAAPSEVASLTETSPVEAAPSEVDDSTYVLHGQDGVERSGAVPAEAQTETAPAAAAINKSTNTADCAKAADEISRVGADSDTADQLFHYRRALRLCPGKADYHVGLGDIYLALNRKSDAEFEFQEALRLDPNNGMAKQRLEETKK
jgi:outer membrane lipoprotein SlyB